VPSFLFSVVLAVYEAPARGVDIVVRVCLGS
jgi:hypothetical protein